MKENKKRFSKGRITAGIIMLIIAVLSNLFIINFHKEYKDTITIKIDVEAEKNFSFSLFYLTDSHASGKGNDFSADAVSVEEYTKKGKTETLSFVVPENIKYIRLDFGEAENDVTLKDSCVFYKDKKIDIISIDENSIISENDISDYTETDNGISISADSGDPYISLSFDNKAYGYVQRIKLHRWHIIQAVMCILIDFILLLYFVRWDSLMTIPRQVVRERKLIFQLSKNDFKTRFAGSYLGIVWAFVQPIVTILLYWFVFSKALRVGNTVTKSGLSVPYVLWLIAGLVPWFYFSEAWVSGTNSLMEYSYLVKKVVFQVSILPVVKIVSSLYVHVFFIGFTVVLYACMGYMPTLYMLQIIYYSFCMIVLVMALSYFCTAVAVFFKDLIQIINILMQVVMWMTPIMWELASVSMPPAVAAILEANPMYYVVSGYRDALINNVWFWNKPELTVLFWSVTLLLFAISSIVFRRLKPHFADML